MLKRLFQRLCLVFIAICTGTVFDWFAHGISPRFEVPGYYFRNKIIFGTLIGTIALYILRRFVRDDRWLAVFSMLAVAILLQMRYALEGYDLTFVLLFLGIHFVVFVIPALILFRLFRRVL